jgi:pimeloyl-ACP methyl ester carboxylesterase
MPEVKLSTGTIRYADSGSGPPVVLVHGLPADGTLWRDVVRHVRCGARWIVPDRDQPERTGQLISGLVAA